MSFHTQGKLESHSFEAEMEKKGPRETVPHPHPEGEGQARPYSFPCRSFATEYQQILQQIPGVLKGTLLSNYESFHLSTRSIKAKDPAKGQQVSITFAP